MQGIYARNKTAKPATKQFSESLKLSENSSLGFVCKVLVAYFFLLHWLYPKLVLNSWFNKALCYVLAWGADLLLSLLTIPHSLSKTLISVDGRPSLYVCTPCSGLDLVWMLGIVVFAYPSSFGSQMYFWMKGTFLICMLNIVRITALSLIHRYWFSVFEINHHLIFNLFVYGCILWMFLKWAKEKNASKLKPDFD